METGTPMKMTTIEQSTQKKAKLPPSEKNIQSVKKPED